MPERRRSLPARWTLLVGVAFVAGVAIRYWIYRSVLGIPNSDEAVVGLMVRHALHGELTVFFWGSPYGGTQQVLLSAPVFAVAGSNYLALRVVPILLSVLACVVVWRAGRRIVGDVAAIVAGLALWVWPPFNLFQLTQHQSFYAADVVYCALLLLLALRLVERPDRGRACVFGLVVGLGFWETAQIVPVAVPLIAWILWRSHEARRHVIPAALCALAGASPWLVWNALHHFASLRVHGSLESYRQSLRLFASPILPMTLGLRAPFGQQPIVSPSALTYLLYAALLALFACGAWRARRSDAFVLYVVAAVFPFVYALDRRTSFISSWPQYTVVLTPVLALLVAQLARGYARAVVLLAVLTVVSVVGLQRMEAWLRPGPSVPAVPRDFTPLIAELDRLGLDRVYADYWIAYRLDFATQERIVAVENSFRHVSFENGRATLPHFADVRFVDYERVVRGSPAGFVFFRRTASSVPIVPALVRHGYRPHPVGAFVVYALKR